MGATRNERLRENRIKLETLETIQGPDDSRKSTQQWAWPCFAAGRSLSRGGGGGERRGGDVWVDDQNEKKGSHLVRI